MKTKQRQVDSGMEVHVCTKQQALFNKFMSIYLQYLKNENYFNPWGNIWIYLKWNKFN